MIHGNKKTAVTVIRYSCLTGQAVWLYQGPSKQAARAAYRRACEKEILMVQGWRKIAARRKANIRRVFNACMETLTITAQLTEEQERAAKELLKMANEPYPCQREFYDHVIEERRRREEDRRIRQQMRNY